MPGGAHSVEKFHAVSLGIVHFPDTGGGLVPAAEHVDPADAFPQCSAGDIHRRVARTNHHEVVAQIVDIRVYQIVDGVVDIAKALAGDAIALGFQTPVPMKMAS